MFTVGKYYKITTLDGPLETIGYITMKVLEVNLPLIKVNEAGPEKIINTSAPTFVSAELQDD